VGEQGLRLLKVPLSCAVALASFEVFKAAAAPSSAAGHHGGHGVPDAARARGTGGLGC
jgi:hypothetical protein